MTTWPILSVVTFLPVFGVLLVYALAMLIGVAALITWFMFSGGAVP